jgi:hypothetical protein
VVSAAGGPWSDDFDSYANGSEIHGQGGWKGWDNVPASGGTVTNVQSRSAPHSLETVGVEDVVHEYSVTDGQWVYTAWQYIPDNMVGQHYFILLNTYADGGPNNWTLQLCFDSTSGNVFDDSAATCSGNSLPFVTDQWAEIRVEIDLDADLFDLYYNNGLLIDNGIWSQHTSGGGDTAIGAVDLWSNGATSVYYDDMSLLEAVVGEPGLDIDKSPDTQDVVMNGNADFTITITNTGTLTWTDVTVTDAEASACDNNFTDLAPGAVETYTCTDTGVAASYTNTAVAVGTITGGPTMTVTDTADVNVVPPTSVSLSGFGGDNVNSAAGWLAVISVVGLTGGFLVVRRRRQQLR